MNISSFELNPFNPDRQKITFREKEQMIEVINAFPDGYTRMLTAELRAAKGPESAKHEAARYGQIAGKLCLRLFEGIPVHKQIEFIREVGATCKEIHQERKIPLNGFLAGVKGEFATGVLLAHAGLGVNYPLNEDDLYHKTDLVARTPQGSQIIVQSKTIFLPENMERSNLKEPLPIFSLVDQDHISEFEESIKSIPATNDVILERVRDILDDASSLQLEAESSGTIPLLCLLGSPDSDGSDIITATARPTGIAEKQAIGELHRLLNY